MIYRMMPFNIFIIATAVVPFFVLLLKAQYVDVA